MDSSSNSSSTFPFRRGLSRSAPASSGRPRKRGSGRSTRKSLEDRFADWVTRRHRVARHEIHLDRRRIYILPTTYGYCYALTLLLMLLGALNYNNSMALPFTFL